MPAGFDSCVSGGGEVRTISGPDDKFGLSDGEYLHVCILDGKFHRGEINKASKLAKNWETSQMPRNYMNPNHDDKGRFASGDGDSGGSGGGDDDNYDSRASALKQVGLRGYNSDRADGRLVVKVGSKRGAIDEKGSVEIIDPTSGLDTWTFSPEGKMDIKQWAKDVKSIIGKSNGRPPKGWKQPEDTAFDQRQWMPF